MLLRQKKHLWLLIIGICLFITALSCKFASAKGSNFLIRDDTGVAITLTKPPRRIVSLAPNMTEILFAVGAGGHVVGVSDYCDFPKEVRKIPHIGGAQIQTESVLGLRPDLVVANAAIQPGIIAQLRAAGLPVIAFRPSRWESVLATIRRVGQAVGCDQAADLVARKMEDRRRVVERKIKGRKRVRVFVEIWNKPLMTAGPGTFIHELIQMAGGDDIAGDQQRPWSVIPTEVVLVRNPQVIILTCKNRGEVMARPGWEEMDSVHSGRVYEVNPDIYSRPGPRLADALENLAALLGRKGSGRP